MDNGPEKNIYSVTELNGYVKHILESVPRLENIYVRGEVSDFKRNALSGHVYFTLKDEKSRLGCVMFKWSAERLRFQVKSGMKVIAQGKMTVYQQGGVYQLQAVSLTPDGVGEMQLAFEQLKERLWKEGLFDERHKIPLPPFPRRIGVVTSASGKAIHDIITVTKSRWPLSEIVLLPVSVQGERAPREIAAAIRYADRWKVADVLIVGRGGGSPEELWCFNDELIARAIYDCQLPVVSAVGHEPDVTICDFAADVRAATPSRAAEIVTPDIRRVRTALRDWESRAVGAAEKRVARERERLDNLAERPILRDPGNILDACRQTLDGKSDRLRELMTARLAETRRHWAEDAARLDALSPLKVLGRGYAIAVKPDGQVIRAKEDARSGEEFTLRLRKDEIACVVK